MRYLIWSHRNDQWWMPDKCGYTPLIAQAGRYDRHQAAEITFDCLPGANVAIPEELALTLKVGDEKAELAMLRTL